MTFPLRCVEELCALSLPLLGTVSQSTFGREKSCFEANSAQKLFAAIGKTLPFPFNPVATFRPVSVGYRWTPAVVMHLVLGRLFIWR